MRKARFVLIALVLVVLLSIAGTAAANNQDADFRANLTGSEEVPPVDTQAQGRAIFKLSPDGTTVFFKLGVDHIQDVNMAHIHVSPVGEVTGPPVVFLYGPLLIPGPFDGKLAEGSFTEADLIGITMAELLTAIEEGRAYVNVHTTAWPAGEIRGTVH